MTYVVLKPNVVFYAFGRCFPVARITSSFVFYTKTAGDGAISWEEKVSKKNVLFFCDEDISKEIHQWNLTCWNEHKEFEKRISALQENAKEAHENKE